MGMAQHLTGLVWVGLFGGAVPAWGERKRRLTQAQVCLLPCAAAAPRRGALQEQEQGSWPLVWDTPSAFEMWKKSHQVGIGVQRPYLGLWCRFGTPWSGTGQQWWGSGGREGKDLGLGLQEEGRALHLRSCSERWGWGAWAELFWCDDR